ncbi:MAG: hypothetical protein ACOCXA_08640, partial [Planctomycetota bacterium]
SGAKEFDLDIGGRAYWDVTMQVPAAMGDSEGQMVLSVHEGDTEHFRDDKPVRIHAWDGVPAPGIERDTYLLDPSGELKARLDERGIRYQEVAAMSDVPEGPHVFLVGRNALSAEEAGSPEWQFLARSGTRIVVFEQHEHPLRARALPATMETSTQSGRIIHPQVSTHPVMTGLDAADFFCWAGDHMSYADAYLKPTGGASPILQAGAALAFTPLVEAQLDNGGLMLLNQTLSLSKIDNDPTARRLTDQIVNHAYEYEPLHRHMREVLPESGYITKMLQEAGVEADLAEDPLRAMQELPHGVVLVAASQEMLAQLARNIEQVREFRRQGGWLVLLNVTPAMLEDFNTVVGVDHLMRPGTREAVSVVLPRPPIATGVNMNDVVMTTGKKISWWKGTEFRAHDAYSHVVDYRDIVPFATINGSEPQRMDNVLPHPRNVANGLHGDEFWRYMTYLEMDKGNEPRLHFELPRQETVDNIEIAFDTGYSQVERFSLDFHDDGEVLTFEVAPGSSPQGFSFEARTTDTITFRITDYSVNAKGKDVIGISTIRMLAQRSQDFLDKVRPVIDPAGIVSYPDGDGGTLLVNVAYRELETNPLNVSKKRNLTKALLSNLGVPFAGGGSVVVGDAALDFQPIAMPESAYNIYPRRDTGDAGKNPWFRAGGWARKEDMTALPGGRQQLDGVLFDLNDFAMADVPTIIALAGKDSPVATERITDIQVNRTADALFFLHTYHPSRRAEQVDKNIRKAKDRGNINTLVSMDYPTVLEYVVHYADGSEAVIPVRYRREIGPWIDEHLPETNAYARVAWQAAAGEGEGYLSVYSMQWNNPEPSKEITTIDIRLPQDTKNLEQYGAPAVFAITSATTD